MLLSSNVIHINLFFVSEVLMGAAAKGLPRTLGSSKGKCYTNILYIAYHYIISYYFANINIQLHYTLISLY